MRWLRHFIALQLACLVASTSPVAEPSSQSVLILDQTSPDLPFYSDLTSSLRLTVDASTSAKISYYKEYLDANRFVGTGYEENLASFSGGNIVTGLSPLSSPWESEPWTSY
jgi:hypothetical protein